MSLDGYSPVKATAMENSSSLPGGAQGEFPAADGTPSQSREAEQQSRQSPAPPSSCSDANSVERHRHGEAPGSGCTSTVVTHRGDVSDTCDMNVVDTHKGSVSDNSNAVNTDKGSVSDHCNTVDTEKGSVSDHCNTVDTEKGSVSNSPRNVDTEKGSVRKDPSTVEALHASTSDDTSTASTRQGKAPDGPQNKLLSVEDCSHNSAEPNVTSTNSVAGGDLNPTPSLDSHSAPLAHSLEPTAPRHPAKSHHSQNVQAVPAASEIATSDKPEELHVSESQSPCSREGWESAEGGGYSCPEEEDSDWEGPVDVELDDTPLALPEVSTLHPRTCMYMQVHDCTTVHSQPCGPTHTTVHSQPCGPTHTLHCAQPALWANTHTTVHSQPCGPTHTHTTVHSQPCGPTHTPLCTASPVGQLTHYCAQPAFLGQHTHHCAQPALLGQLTLQASLSGTVPQNSAVIVGYAIQKALLTSAHLSTEIAPTNSHAVSALRKISKSLSVNTLWMY